MKNVLSRLYDWYGKRVVWGAGVVILLLLAVGGIFHLLQNSDTTPEASENTAPAVTVARVSALSGGETLELVGTVESVNEVALESEAGGRITRVYVGLGDTVGAGATIATIENASERASLLQAEGAYEAALASAASSNVSAQSAETTYDASLTSGVSAYRNAFITVDSAVRTTVDDVFSSPRSPSPGLYLDGFGRATSYTEDRVVVEDLLEEWSRNLEDVHEANIQTRLPQAIADTEIVRALVEDLAFLVARQDTNTTVNGMTKTSLETSFASARSTVSQTLQTLANAETAITNAGEARERARIAGTGGTTSSADAQVKQALGALRAAQATYAKTVISTPIAGTVNTLNVKSGDYVGVQSPIARVANNNTLLITTYVSARERDRIAIGDPVRVNNDGTGVVGKIAPAIDPVTQRIEVQIQTTDASIENGATVRLALIEGERSETSDEISIPITALKVATDRVMVFTVTEDNLLQAHEVTTGPLLGEFILIESGVTADMEIVVDARGRNEGDAVRSQTK